MTGSKGDWIVRLLRVSARAALAALVLWALVLIPLPQILGPLLERARVPGAVLIFLLYVGKLVIDTFFFDRYPH